MHLLCVTGRLWNNLQSAVMDGSQGSGASTPHPALLPAPAALQPLQICFHYPEWLFSILSHSGISAWQVFAGRALGSQQCLGAWLGEGSAQCGLLLVQNVLGTK